MWLSAVITIAALPRFCFIFHTASQNLQKAVLYTLLIYSGRTAYTTKKLEEEADLKIAKN